MRSASRPSGPGDGRDGGGQDTVTGDPRLPATVRLLRRRHIWGTAAVLVIALAIMFAGTKRLNRLPGEVRAAAAETARRQPAVAHRPFSVHARHFPLWRFFSLLCLWLVLAVVVSMGVLGGSGLPDGVAYLAGGGRSATFIGHSYGQDCDALLAYTCPTDTIGVLSRPGSPNVSFTWHSQVPLGQPFKLRVTVWSFRLGSTLISGNRTAIVAIVLSLLLDVFAILSLIVAVTLILLWLPRRRQGARRAKHQLSRRL